MYNDVYCECCDEINSFDCLLQVDEKFKNMHNRLKISILYQMMNMRMMKNEMIDSLIKR